MQRYWKKRKDLKMENGKLKAESGEAGVIQLKNET